MGNCCSCGCKEASGKKVIVEYLYLDIDTCNRCIGTDTVLDEVVASLTPALNLAGYKVVYNKTKMETAEIAIKHHFVSSPTIRVNGNDICQSVSENSCECCSDISGTDVDCRIFEYNGKYYEVPPKEMLADAILKAVYVQDEKERPCSDYELPENLKQFFNGKDNKKCSCENSCCGGDYD